MVRAFFERWSGLWRSLLVLVLWVLAWGALHAVLSESPSAGVKAWNPLLAALMVAGSAWLGWVVRQGWVYPARLRRAETIWVSGGFASDVVDALAPVHMATGELGYRVWLLRSRANLALGFRNLAWAESEEAHLARTPFWLRPFLRGYLRSIPGRSRVSLDRTGSFWLRLAPEMPMLKWRLAIQYLRLNEPGTREKAWDLLLGAMPRAGEDPVLLEDLMLALLGRIQESEEESGRLGRQERAPEFRLVFERVLDLLLHRHGGPRVGWDRVPPVVHLLRGGRHDEALALCRSLPAETRPEALWVAMVAAFRGMGSLDSAWEVTEQALAAQPESFRLWMMREDLALELRRHTEALEALERARALLSDRAGAPLEPLREWHVRRAEYAYWVEEDAEEAARHLDYLPVAADTEGRAPLRLLVLLDLGRFDEAHREAMPLLEQNPGDPELQLVQAESLAGMEAWDSLKVCLEAMGEDARQRSDFWHLRGICRSHLEDLLGAREDLERAAQMEPGNLRYVLDAGHACADLGEWERSEFHWRQALRQDEQSEEALTQLAEARRTLHDPEGAKRLLRECLLHHPESGTAQAMLAELEAN